MRMERPMQLAAYLLGADSTQAALPTEAECEAAPQSRSLTLRHPMPLHVAYTSCGFTPMYTGATRPCGGSCLGARNRWVLPLAPGRANLNDASPLTFLY